MAKLRAEAQAPLFALLLKLGLERRKLGEGRIRIGLALAPLRRGESCRATGAGVIARRAALEARLSGRTPLLARSVAGPLVAARRPLLLLVLSALTGRLPMRAGLAGARTRHERGAADARFRWSPARSARLWPAQPPRRALPALRSLSPLLRAPRRLLPRRRALAPLSSALQRRRAPRPALPPRSAGCGATAGSASAAAGASAAALSA